MKHTLSYLMLAGLLLFTVVLQAQIRNAKGEELSLICPCDSGVIARRRHPVFSTPMPGVRIIAPEKAIRSITAGVIVGASDGITYVRIKSGDYTIRYNWVLLDSSLSIGDTVRQGQVIGRPEMTPISLVMSNSHGLIPLRRALPCKREED